jgi:antitoxin component YwqK of YwqJK toxin-antitoxin module
MGAGRSVARNAGIFRKWYDDGKLESETYMVRGLPTGRLRHWDEAGELIEAYFYKGRRISQKKYESLAAIDTSLPKI